MYSKSTEDEEAALEKSMFFAAIAVMGEFNHERSAQFVSKKVLAALFAVGKVKRLEMAKTSKYYNCECLDVVATAFWFYINSLNTADFVGGYSCGGGQLLGFAQAIIAARNIAETNDVLTGEEEFNPVNMFFDYLEGDIKSVIGIVVEADKQSG